MAKVKKGGSGIGTVILGAALGVAATVLADKKNRKVIKKTVSDVVDEGEKRIDLARKYIDGVGAKAGRRNVKKLKVVKRKKRSTQSTRTLK